jgi:hypothetical protein
MTEAVLWWVVAALWVLGGDVYWDAYGRSAYVKTAPASMNRFWARVVATAAWPFISFGVEVVRLFREKG